MIKIFRIIVIIGILLSVANISLGKELQENIDYKCVDKGVTENPPPKIKNVEDKNFTPLCTNGKVPKAIYSAEQIQALDKKIKEVPHSDKKNISDNKSLTATCGLYGACYDWAETELGVDNNGVQATLTQHDPGISSDSYHTLAEIAVNHATQNSNLPGNYVETGWIKDYGDITRLFTFWWKDGVGQCYNDLCNGWVQYSSKYYPGMSLGVDTYGKSYGIMSGSNNNWWIWYDDEWLGYYPGSLWNNQFTHGDTVLYYGEVASKVAQTTTQMGSGAWASDVSSAARFLNPSFLNASGWMPSRNFGIIISSQNLYTLEPYFDEYYTNYLRYGGPGGTPFDTSTLVLKTPNTGESLYPGQKTDVTWYYEGAPGPFVKLEVLKPDGSYVSTITTSAAIGDAGLGEFLWSIPLTLKPGDYKVKITSSYMPLFYYNEIPFTIQKDYKKLAFARGSDNALWYRMFDGMFWSNWQSLGGTITSDPDAVSSSGSVYVVARGTDNGLWIRKWDGNTFTNWNSLGGILSSGPGIASLEGTSKLYVFVRGSDNALWYRPFDGLAWKSWQSLGGILSSDPDAANSLDVAVKGSDNALWIRPYNKNTNSWNNWYSIGGTIKGGPSITSGKGLRVFARGTGDDLWTRYYSSYDGWSSWQNIGGKLASDPEATSDYIRNTVSVRGSDNALWYMTDDGNYWSNWHSLGGIITSGPEIVDVI